MSMSMPMSISVSMPIPMSISISVAGMLNGSVPFSPWALWAVNWIFYFVFVAFSYLCLVLLNYESFKEAPIPEPQTKAEKTAKRNEMERLESQLEPTGATKDRVCRLLPRRRGWGDVDGDCVCFV